MPALDTTTDDMEKGEPRTNGSWENLKQAEGLKNRASTMQHLKFYGAVSTPVTGLIEDQELTFSLLLYHGEQQPLLEDEEESEPGYTYPLLLSCLVAVINAFQYGYNTGVTGAIDPTVIFAGHSDMVWAVCVSIFAAGGPIGSLAGGQVSAKIGRKKTMLVNSCIFIISGALMAFAVNIYMLILGRFLVGISSGTATVIVPLYLGELAPPNLRGALGTTYQVAMVLGILGTDLLAFGFAGESHGFTDPGWRFMFGFTGVLGVLQLVLAPLVIESPRWLLSNDKAKEAETTLQRLRQSDDVVEEIDSIASANDDETGDAPGIWDVLCDRSIRFPLVVAVVLQFAQQLSGINAVMFYASSFFENVGLENPLVGTTLVYVVNVLSTIVALMLMDSAGRRPLLIWSLVGMILSSVVLTLGLMKMLPLASIFSVGGVMSFVWFFEIGLGPIPWLIAAEMFPPKSRTTATSIATMVNWLGLFIIGIVFPTMQSGLGEYIFVPFAGLLVFALGFSLQFVPETKGKTLDEIQDELSPDEQ
ncbi:hypothetical protein BBJ28_00022775 [Nothophytophthora sp. Chile5]|nr:hypothetical protein BBJ28_00022775 [Nothophytophthora sp. Chile5]